MAMEGEREREREPVCISEQGPWSFLTQAGHSWTRTALPHTVAKHPVFVRIWMSWMGFVDFSGNLSCSMGPWNPLTITFAACGMSQDPSDQPSKELPTQNASCRHEKGWVDAAETTKECSVLQHIFFFRAGESTGWIFFHMAPRWKWSKVQSHVTHGMASAIFSFHFGDAFGGVIVYRFYTILAHHSHRHPFIRGSSLATPIPAPQVWVMCPGARDWETVGIGCFHPLPS